jgi:Tfp pilus assembly protein PilW
MTQPILRAQAGTSLVDVLISMAITSMLATAMFVGMLTVQRSFRAARHYAKSQIEQARILDYIARDLRRANSVNVDTFEGSERLQLTIPDFYKPDSPSGQARQPRDPVIYRGAIQYGSSANPVRISYYKVGAEIFRSENGSATLLASDVQEFILDYTDSGEQAVSVSVSFVPRFQRNPRNGAALREGTATYATTLLRNKRQ